MIRGMISWKWCRAHCSARAEWVSWTLLLGHTFDRFAVGAWFPNLLENIVEAIGDVLKDRRDYGIKTHRLAAPDSLAVHDVFQPGCPRVSTERHVAVPFFMRQDPRHTARGGREVSGVSTSSTQEAVNKRKAV